MRRHRRPRNAPCPDARGTGVQYVFRVPCIPGVNDAAADRAAFRAWAGKSAIEFLPYNPAAGAKYPLLGRDFPFSP